MFDSNGRTREVCYARRLISELLSDPFASAPRTMYYYIIASYLDFIWPSSRAYGSFFRGTELPTLYLNWQEKHSPISRPLPNNYEVSNASGLVPEERFRKTPFQ
jgi:hypothetical protein